MAKGLPDIDSLANYGGALQNYAPVVDPTTDEDAAYRNLYAANVAALTHTGCRAMVSFVGNGTTPTDPTSGFVHDSLWGSAPAVKPVVARSLAGKYTITWPATVVDELGVTHTLNLRRSKGHVEGAGTLYHAAPEVSSPNVVSVYTYLANGTADDLVGKVITIWVW